MQFLRKREVLRRCGMSRSTLHEAINAGKFPPADGYLGPQSPFWTDRTVTEWQQARLEEGGQPQPTPRRRKAAAAELATIPA